MPTTDALMTDAVILGVVVTGGLTVPVPVPVPVHRFLFTCSCFCFRSDSPALPPPATSRQKNDGYCQVNPKQRTRESRTQSLQVKSLLTGCASKLPWGNKHQHLLLVGSSASSFKQMPGREYTKNRAFVLLLDCSTNSSDYNSPPFNQHLRFDVFGIDGKSSSGAIAIAVTSRSG
jgi:hypothetical protein